MLESVSGFFIFEIEAFSEAKEQGEAEKVFCLRQEVFSGGKRHFDHDEYAICYTNAHYSIWKGL